MSSHRFFTDPKNIESGKTVTITGQDVNHIKNVLRMHPGQTIIVSDGHGRDFDVTISRITDTDVQGEAIVRKSISPPKPALTVFQAIPKARKMDIVVEKLTEIGIMKIEPFIAPRTVVDFRRGQQEKRLGRWKALVLQAAQQSQRSFLPVVSEITKWPDILGKMLPYNYLVVPWEGESNQGIKDALPDEAEEIGLVIGPEGGFSQDEVLAMVEIGAKTVCLGRNILRAETAAIVASTLVLDHFGELGQPIT